MRERAIGHGPLPGCTRRRVPGEHLVDLERFRLANRASAASSWRCCHEVPGLMPESPRNRFRRNRATRVGGDLGRLAGKPLPPTYESPPKQELDPPRPPTPRQQRRQLEQEVRRDLEPLHRARKELIAPGRYRVWCSCGDWSAEIPARKKGSRSMSGFREHLQQLVDAEMRRRQLPVTTGKYRQRR
jgi:hypothetical protein